MKICEIKALICIEVDTYIADSVKKTDDLYLGIKNSTSAFGHRLLISIFGGI
jgi:hypothetical protein